jgi:hypothetical protein
VTPVLQDNYLGERKVPEQNPGKRKVVLSQKTAALLAPLDRTTIIFLNN